MARKRRSSILERVYIKEDKWLENDEAAPRSRLGY